MAMQGSQESVLIPRTRQWHMRSVKTGRKYRIFAAIPEGAAPQEGYPVIYVLDANAVFATVVEALRAQSRRPEKTGVVPAVVVGIGYDNEAPFSSMRTFDFTLPRAEGEAPYSFKGRELAEQGGAEYFADFIEQELKPVIEAGHAINRGQQSIIGHSLGGLFVLQTLLKNPGAFQNYIAGSPSIHWNKEFICEAEPRLYMRLKEARTPVRVLIAVGQLETAYQMIENARELAERFAAHARAGEGIEVVFKQFEDEAHISVLPVLMSQAIRFALKQAASSSGQKEKEA